MARMLAGTVRDASNRPVSGTPVYLAHAGRWAPIGTTDGDGRFAYWSAMAHPGERVTLAAGEGARAVAQLAPGQDGAVDLRMGQPGTVRSAARVPTAQTPCGCAGPTSQTAAKSAPSTGIAALNGMNGCKRNSSPTSPGLDLSWQRALIGVNVPLPQAFQFGGPRLFYKYPYTLGQKQFNPNGSVTFGTCAEAVAWGKQANLVSLMMSMLFGPPFDPTRLPFVVICNPDSDGGTVYPNPTPGFALAPGCGEGVAVFTLDNDDMTTFDPDKDFVQQVIDSDNPPFGVGWAGPQVLGCTTDGDLAGSIAAKLSGPDTQYMAKANKDGTYSVVLVCPVGQVLKECDGIVACHNPDFKCTKAAPVTAPPLCNGLPYTAEDVATCNGKTPCCWNATTWKCLSDNGDCGYA